MPRRPTRREIDNKVRSLDKEVLDLIRARDASQRKTEERHAEFNETDGEISP